MINKKIALILAIAISYPIIGLAEDQVAQNQDQDKGTRARLETIKDQSRFHTMVEESMEVYSSIAKGTNREVPASVLRNARCIAVIPNVITGALIVGGAHGEGLASCKDANNSWSQPAAVSLNQGSLGLQAGAKSADLVMYFQSKDAVNALKKGNFAIGSDISAVAGNYDNSVDTSGAGVVVYSRTQGAFAGASVTGSKIGNDKDDLASYYGKKVDYTALLENRETPDSAGVTQKLTKLFP